MNWRCQGTRHAICRADFIWIFCVTLRVHFSFWLNFVFFVAPDGWQRKRWTFAVCCRSSWRNRNTEHFAANWYRDELRVIKVDSVFSHKIEDFRVHSQAVTQVTSETSRRASLPSQFCWFIWFRFMPGELVSYVTHKRSMKRTTRRSMAQSRSALSPSRLISDVLLSTQLTPKLSQVSRMFTAELCQRMKPN